MQVLSELQDRLPAFSTTTAMAILEDELGKPVTEMFSDLSEEPVAAASFGQAGFTHWPLLVLFFEYSFLSCSP